MCVTMTINRECRIAKAKTVFHWISKQIYFRIRRKKVRSTTLFCYNFPCVLNPLLYTTNQCFPCMVHRPPMIMIKRKIIDFWCNWTFSLEKQKSLNINIAYYFLETLASRHENTWHHRVGPITPKINNFSLNHNHRRSVEHTRKILISFTEKGVKYTGKM